jgi:probable F420-dependent oxidoreductase
MRRAASSFGMARGSILRPRMGEGLRVAITLSGLSRLFGASLDGVVDFAAQADAAGVDQIAVPDHLAIGPRTDRYPYGAFPLPLDEPWLEPLTALAALAGATRRIRLASSVLIAPLRPALVLAKTLATLDVLSGGRLDLGVGIGWQREEFEAAGVPFEARAARLDDQLRACRALWSGGPVSFRSPTVAFDELVCLPRPLQPGGIPIWFGVALTPKNVDRIAELGAGWLPIGSDLAEIARGIAVLRKAFAKAGRDPAALGVRAHAPALDALPRMRDAGVTIAAFALGRFARSHEGLRPFLNEIAALR